ncbi:MAG TPA: hypothetical protein VK996_18895 [Ramlibacter sp.]|nr:hypothetical protein [Ramlibacter sp.]
MTRLRLADLDPTGHTSFSFYDFLPGQGFEVGDAAPAATAPDMAARLLRSDLFNVPDEELDRFAAVLITHGADLTPNDDYGKLANATAHAFAALIGNDAQRPRRMRLTRLSLMLRVILDRDQDLSGARSESVLPCKSPWDFIAVNRSTTDGWAASSDDDNLRRLEAGKVPWSRRCGLPTQVDALGDSLWVGSHYSDGGDIVRGLDAAEPDVTHIAHGSPLVFAFDWDRQRWALDAAGALFRIEESRIGGKTLQLPGKVHRARVIGDTLYAFDWGQAGVTMQIDLGSMQVRTARSGDIIVCNDVCGHGEFLYGICKLQGRVFKMAKDWTTLGTSLGAGIGPSQLLDPIMIRSDGDGRLSVLNWFSAKLVELEAF